MPQTPTRTASFTMRAAGRDGGSGTGRGQPEAESIGLRRNGSGRGRRSSERNQLRKDERCRTAHGTSPDKRRGLTLARLRISRAGWVRSRASGPDAQPIDCPANRGEQGAASGARCRRAAGRASETAGQAFGAALLIDVDELSEFLTRRIVPSKTVPGGRHNRILDPRIRAHDQVRVEASGHLVQCSEVGLRDVGPVPNHDHAMLQGVDGELQGKRARGDSTAGSGWCVPPARRCSGWVTPRLAGRQVSATEILGPLNARQLRIGPGHDKDDDEQGHEGLGLGGLLRRLALEPPGFFGGGLLTVSRLRCLGLFSLGHGRETTTGSWQYRCDRRSNGAPGHSGGWPKELETTFRRR